MMQLFTNKRTPMGRERVITLDDGAIYDGNAIWARFGNNGLRAMDGDLAEASYRAFHASLAF
jgi:hypothetical protein